MTGKILGFRPWNFTTQDGKEIRGYNVFVEKSQMDAAEDVVGADVDTLSVSERILDGSPLEPGAPVRYRWRWNAEKHKREVTVFDVLES